MSGGTSSLLWYVARGSGIVAFLLLTFSVGLGIAMNRRWYSRNWPRMVVDAMHRWFTVTFFTFTLIHVVTILLDPFSNVSLMNALIPFTGGYRPVWVSLGVIAIELGLAIGASVWVRRFIGYRAWHIMHGLAYPIYGLSLLHGIFAGIRHRHGVDEPGLWRQRGAHRDGDHLAARTGVQAAHDDVSGRRTLVGGAGSYEWTLHSRLTNRSRDQAPHPTICTLLTPFTRRCGAALRQTD